jgi:hypothetical protein
MSRVWGETKKNDLIIDAILNSLCGKMRVVAINNQNSILALRDFFGMAIEVVFEVSLTQLIIGPSILRRRNMVSTIGKTDSLHSMMPFGEVFDAFKNCPRR